MTSPTDKVERYLDEVERRIEGLSVLEGIRLQVEANRAIERAKPLPRNTCPGCFLAIYDGAAKQGWCCDCMGKY